MITDKKLRQFFRGKGDIMKERFIWTLMVFVGLFVVPAVHAAGIDQYTKLMIHSNTFDGNTVFTDSSFWGHTITGNGVHHSTDRAKFGSSSIYFDTDDDYLTAPDSSDFVFGTGDFTIDFWVYRNSNPLIESWFGATGSGNTNGWGLQYGNATDSLIIWLGNLNKVTFGSIGLTTNTWQHLAAVRSNGDIYLFLDGSQVGSTQSLPYDQSANAYDLYIGRQPDWDIGYINGNIDEYRISKGIARWTEDFIPSDEPYTVPIPGSVLLLGSTLICLLGFRRRFARNESNRQDQNQSKRRHIMREWMFDLQP